MNLFRSVEQFNLFLILQFSTAMTRNSSDFNCHLANDLMIHHIPYIKSSRKIVCYLIVSKELNQHKNSVLISSQL